MPPARFSFINLLQMVILLQTMILKGHELLIFSLTGFNDSEIAELDAIGWSQIDLVDLF